MKICYYGTYDQKYTRSVINISGLQENHVDIIACHVQKPKFNLENNTTRLLFYVQFPVSVLSRNFRLFFKGLNLYITYHYDLIFVGDTSNYEVFGAYLLGKIIKKKVIFDPLASPYDMYTSENNIFRNTFIEDAIKYIEKITYALPDLNLVHTYQDLLFFHKTFAIPIKKLAVLYIGAMEPKKNKSLKKQKNKKFTIVYSGVFIPLHGVEHILNAAKLALANKDIQFIFTGVGIGYKDAAAYVKKEKLTNVEMLGWISNKDLSSVLASADIVLGIFQDNAYMPRCIPNKVFQAISFGKPTISANSPGIRELFTHKKNIYLCKAGDPKSLYDAILFLKNNPEVAQTIATGGKALYDTSLTPKAIGKDLVTICKQFL